MGCRALLAALATALVIPGAVYAAKPIDLGVGRAPHVAVDAGGRGHVTFSTTTAGQDESHYCRLPPGATVCDKTATFSYPQGPQLGGSSGVWPLLPGDPRVLVLDARCCTNYATKFVYAS